MKAFLHNKESASRPRVVISIADDKLSAAVVSSVGSTPQITWSDQQPLQNGVAIDAGHQHQSIRQNLSALLRRLQAALHQHHPQQSVTQVDCLLSGPWHIDDVVTTEIRDGKPTLLTNHRLQQAVTSAHQQFRRQSRSTVFPDDEFSHLHHRIATITTNGSRLSLPHDHPVADFDLQMHISKIPQRLRRAITQALEERFRPDLISLRSFTDLSVRTLARQHSLSRRFIFVLVGSSETEVLQVVDDSLQQVTAFPVGREFLVRVAADALERPVGDIYSRLSLHKKQRQHEDQIREIRVAAEEVGEHWSGKFRRAVGVENGAHRTTHVYVLSDADVVGDLFHDYAEESARAVNLSVHRIDERFFADRFVRQYNELQPDHRLQLAVLSTG